jgi:putative addiction module component (TIGR02574 family)
MSVSEIVEQIRALTPDERWQVIERIEKEFPESDAELSSEQMAELDRRAQAALKYPERGRPAEEVFAETHRTLRSGK